MEDLLSKFLLKYTDVKEITSSFLSNTLSSYASENLSFSFLASQTF